MTNLDFVSSLMRCIGVGLSWVKASILVNFNLSTHFFPLHGVFSSDCF